MPQDIGVSARLLLCLKIRQRECLPYLMHLHLPITQPCSQRCPQNLCVANSCINDAMSQQIFLTVFTRCVLSQTGRGYALYASPLPSLFCALCGHVQRWPHNSGLVSAALSRHAGGSDMVTNHHTTLPDGHAGRCRSSGQSHHQDDIHAVTGSACSSLPA